MTAAPSWPPSTRIRRRRRRRGLLRLGLWLLGAAVVFGLGVAFGQTLDDNPDPSSSPTRTVVRTLGPLPLRAPPTVTVTVTRP
jgi:hypothetical protein